MRQKKGYSVVGLLGIILAIGIVVGVSIIVINRNRESQQVVEKREDTPINRREQNRIERDISNNLDNGLLPNIELPKVESQIVDNIEPIVNRRYIPRFRSLVNNKLAVNKPSIPSIPSIPLIPDQPSIPSIPNTPEIPVIPEIPTPPNPPTPPTPPQPPVLLAGQRDLSFDTGVSPSDNIPYVSIIQSDGKILVGGYFDHYRGESANNIIRLNLDGTRDTTFEIGIGFNNDVYALAQQSDGKILVGGAFTEYNGNQANRIIRLNSDGTKDTSFNISTGFDSNVNTIAIQSNDKIIVGGWFNNYEGSLANKIIRLNSDGTKDSSFEMGNGFDRGVNTIFLQADNKILVGGSFYVYQGLSYNGIARLNHNGSIDYSFNVGSGFGGLGGVSIDIKTIMVQNGDKILVGGYFGSYQVSNKKYLIRLNFDGSIDVNFDVGNKLNGGILTIIQQADSKIILGGYFNEYNGVQSNRIIRINSDEVIDNTFDIGTGLNGEVYTLNQQSDGKILIGGNFDQYNGDQTNYIIRLNNDGNIDNNTFKSIRDYRTGFNSDVNTLSIQSDGKIVVGGWFDQYNGETVNKIARLNEDGSLDTSFNTGTGFDGGVHTLIQQADGKILVGGWFNEYNGDTANRIARLNEDGSLDTSFNTGTGFDGGVHTLIQQADGKILVGGWFDQYNGETVNKIARLNEDGSLDTTFDTSTSFNSEYPQIYTMAIQSDGKIVLGGYYLDEYEDNGLARLNTDGSRDTSFTTFQENEYSEIYALAIQNDGKILVGGYFYDGYQGQPAAYLIRVGK